MTTLEAIAVIVGVVSGISGLVLGILNYWHQRDTTRPRLVIRLAPARIQEESTNAGIVQICNVGHVPVRIMRLIGLLPTPGHKGPLFVSAVPADGGKLTEDIELKPQNATILRFEMPEGHQIGRVLVQSIVGDNFKISRREMRKFVERQKHRR